VSVGKNSDAKGRSSFLDLNEERRAFSVAEAGRPVGEISIRDESGQQDDLGVFHPRPLAHPGQGSRDANPIPGLEIVDLLPAFEGR
jgi:hypothetical protein